MNESEMFVLIQLFIPTVLITIILWYSWFRISMMINQFEDSSQEVNGLFSSIAYKLQERHKHILFTIMIFSFPFVFIWILSLVLIPNAFGEIFENSWFQLVVLLAIVSVALIERTPDESDFEDEEVIL